VSDHEAYRASSYEANVAALRGIREAIPVDEDVQVVAVTLHTDGTFGLMFRRSPGDATECTCGWPDHEPPRTAFMEGLADR
jgi:hypothetical protein